MELMLIPQAETQVMVECNGQPSHTFDLRSLIPDPQIPQCLPQPLEDPVAYGKAVYAALFAPGSPSRKALDLGPDRLLLVAVDDVLDSVPWEYAHDSADFIVLDLPFVRGLPAEQRIPPPALDAGLHIVAVPSDPLDPNVPRLNIEGEWERLAEIVREAPAALILERTRPPTLEQLRRQIANQRHRVIHFMGHGGQNDKGAILCFEKDDGGLEVATAKEFVRLAKGSVFLVSLNACVSATPGLTTFSNLAATLVRQKTPYALGMRFSVFDDDARTFSRVLYSELARGVSVEEAVRQVRGVLARGPHRWTIGVPVLYTALSAPSLGFSTPSGRTQVIDRHSRLDLMPVLPRAEGTFQGRVAELQTIGAFLTSDNRPRILTIHGAGGQGKSVLAREAVERFAWAWPGGVVAISLESLSTREQFIGGLARFLNIDLTTSPDLTDLEQQILAQLTYQRTLVVLDNAESLIERIEQDDVAALELVDFIRHHLQGPRVTLLVTSRIILGWTGETIIELPGLMPEEGRCLFRDSAPRRWIDANEALTRRLSMSVEGHPLSLRLLGSAFDACNLSLEDFVLQHEAELLHAEDKYRKENHRHRTLYASIDTSVRYLGDDLRSVLSRLWVFHAPFLPDMAALVVQLAHTEGIEENLSIRQHLYALWRRGLLARTIMRQHDGNLEFYQLHSAMRPYVEHYLQQKSTRELILAQFAAACAGLVQLIDRELDHDPLLIRVAQQCREDLDRGLSLVADNQRISYLIQWSTILRRLGDRRHSLKLAESALEISQGANQEQELQAMTNLAIVYEAIGQLQRALQLLEQVLLIRREIGDYVGEASTLSNMAQIYGSIGQPQRALEIYEQVLPIRRESRDRTYEAVTLSRMAAAYRSIGQTQQALQSFEQALLIMREMDDRIGEATILNNMADVYRITGQPQRAFQLYEQTRPILHEMGDRSGEATLLNNIGGLYQSMGLQKEALPFFEQALPILQEVNDRNVEAKTLNNMAEVYRFSGQPKEALPLYEQALTILHEIGNRASEAGIISNIALVHAAIGQLQQALEFQEQALLIMREVGDRIAEANTIYGMAGNYMSFGQPHRALQLYEQALPIMREVGDRGGEAATLHGMAMLYDAIKEPQRALQLIEQALPIIHEVADHAGEAAILNGKGLLLKDMGRFSEALASLEQSIVLAHQIGDGACEIASVIGAASILYAHLGREAAAIEYLNRALVVFEKTQLPTDASGNTPEQTRLVRDALLSERHSHAPQGDRTKISLDQIQIIVSNTITVMTTVPEEHSSMRSNIERSLESMRQGGDSWRNEVEFFTALLTILDSEEINLPDDHPYATHIASIKNSIIEHSLRTTTANEVLEAVRTFVYAENLETARIMVEAQQNILFQAEVDILFEQNIAQSAGKERALLEQRLQILRDCKCYGIGSTFDRLISDRLRSRTTSSSSDADFLGRLKAMFSTPEEQLGYVQLLTELAAQTEDSELKSYITSIQTELFGDT